MKVRFEVPKPRRLAILLGILFGSVAVATTFQSVTDAQQTFSNDKTWNGNQTVNGDAGFSNNVNISGNLNFGQSGAQHVITGNLTVTGDAGFTGNVTLGSLTSNAHTVNGTLCLTNALDCVGDTTGVFTSDAGIAINSGTAETNLVPTLSFMDRAAPTQTFAMECGADAGTTGALTVTLHFANVGATLPVCFCNDINAAQKACNPSAAPTATNASFIGEGGASDVLSYCCIGPK